MKYIIILNIFKNEIYNIQINIHTHVHIQTHAYIRSGRTERPPDVDVSRFRGHILEQRTTSHVLYSERVLLYDNV